MSHAYDPELAPMLEFLPTISIEDPVAARQGLDSMIAQLNTEHGLCLQLCRALGITVPA